jgi:LysR family transcriptional regulator for metE and metH
MQLDRRHLHKLRAIQQAGSMAKAADRLHVTQSALSHQIKTLEDYYGVALFHRHTKPLRLSAAGRQVVALAERVLPMFAQLEQDLQRMAAGSGGRLHLSVECHACFEWLMPVITSFCEQWPAIDIDVRLSLTFNSLSALREGDIDLVITSDPFDTTELVFEPLFGYESRLVMPVAHRLAAESFVVPEALAEEILITYPVERERMDVFKYFLMPQGVEPKQVRQAELTAMILLLITSRQGLAALPDWVMRYSPNTDGLTTRPLGEQGLRRTLYAAVRKEDQSKAYIQEFITCAGQSVGAYASQVDEG